MGRVLLAFKTFFKILTDADLAQSVEEIQQPSPVSKIEEKAIVAPKPSAPPSRSDALTLLEALQREARLIDFLNEDLSTYQDAQVGAAVREVHRGCNEVMQRYFAIEAAVSAEEGQPYEVTESTNTAEVRLTSNVTNARPLTGTLVHSGWKAAKCDLPKWSGSSESKQIIAPAEVEIS